MHSLGLNIYSTAVQAPLKQCVIALQIFDLYMRRFAQFATICTI